MEKQKSLADVAGRRLRLAGGAPLADDLFSLSVDKARREAAAQGIRFVSFADYDYLGLSDHPAIKAAGAAASDETGLGAPVSRIIGGQRSDLESAIAAFVGVEAAMTLVSGYLTHVTVIQHVTDARDVIFLDEFSQSSLVSGCKSSPADVVFFRHNDLAHLDQLLEEKRGDYKTALIVSESLFTIDGSIVDLPRLLDLKKKHSTWLLLDEAHSIGVLGEEGRGLCEYAGVDPDEIDLILGTLSTSFASSGGFICAKAAVIEWFRYSLPGFVYSVALSPTIAAAALAAIEVARTETWRVRRLAQQSELFVRLARDAGLDTGPAVGRGIVPVVLKDSYTTLAASKFLLQHGIHVPPIVQHGVPSDQTRLRFVMSASHTEADIRAAIDCVALVAFDHPPSDAGGADTMSAGDWPFTGRISSKEGAVSDERESLDTTPTTDVVEALGLDTGADAAEAIRYEQTLERLFSQAMRIFGSMSDAREFMISPHRELDDRCPIDAARTAEGTARVARILQAVEFGLAF